MKISLILPCQSKPKCCGNSPYGIEKEHEKRSQGPQFETHHPFVQWIRKNEKELNDRWSEADEQSLLKGSVLSEREKKEDSPDAAPDKARIEPRRCESRSKLDSQRGRNPGFSKEPEHGAVHKAAKNS